MKIKAYTFKIAILCLISCAISSCSYSAEFSIKEDRFYLGDKPFFINAVGYAPWRPGQWPGTDNVEANIIDYDFKMIKAAGFNTIRTWDALNEKELSLARKHNLYVIQGIWIEPGRDFSDKQWQDMQIDRIKKVVNYSKEFTNVLFYLIMTEPKTQAVIYAGEKETEIFFRKIADTVRKIDKRPVSMDSWIPVGFLDHSMWDVATFNVFMFAPESINKVMGFKRYVEFIKENYAKDTPLFIGETGGFSVSKTRRGDLPYGGNTEEEQSKGNIDSIKKCISAGAAGVCTVSWIDTWHYPGDPTTHDDEPWQWSGIIALEDKDDPYGRPRKVYYDLKEFNKALQVKKESKVLKQANMLIEPIKDIFKPGDEIKVNITVSSNNKPLPNRVIKYGFFTEQGWREYDSKTISDENGKISVVCNLAVDGDTGYVLAFASLEDDQYEASYIKFIQIEYKKDHSDYFWVFKNKDFPGNHYIQSGWIGDYQGLKFQDDIVLDDNSKNTCIKISYDPQKDGPGWAGIFWQNPVNNWGNKRGGYNLVGKKELIFSAKGERGGEIISDFISGAVQIGEYPDSSYSRIGPIVLTKEWRQYRINLKNKDLSYISGGFGFVVQEKDNPKGCVFFIDDIYYK
jgi:hypothetical protein